MKDCINRRFRLKQIRNEFKLVNLNMVIFLLKIFHFIFYLASTEEQNINPINFSSQIHLLINGSGTQNLLNNSFYLKPSKVYINGIYNDSCKMSCELEYEENNITLVFNDNLNSTYSMFFDSNNIIEIDFTLFDFSHVTTMENMFKNCFNLTKINFGDINTSSVVNMRSLFYNCKQLILLDVSNFDTSKVTSMEGMFYNCSSLTSINVSNFNTSNVENLRIFMYNCNELREINISNFDTSKVTIMDAMFYTIIHLTSIDITNFNTSKVMSFRLMFFNCKELVSIDLSNFDTSSAINLEKMFYNCSGLLTIDVTKFNITNVKSIRSLFYNCNKLATLNVSNFDTSKVTDMRYLFYNLTNLESIDISNFNIQNINSLSCFFYNCKKLVSIDISFFDTSKIKDFSYLFYGCEKLESLNLLSTDTSSSTNMQSLFYRCVCLKSLDLTNFDTSSVSIMNYMFYDCHSLKSLKFSSLFKTSNVTTMISMFENCKSLISLNLSSFDTYKVSKMNNMFCNCYNLKYLNIPHFSPKNLAEINKIFYNMSSLIYLNIDSLEINDKTKKNSSFDNLPSDLKICSNKINMQNYLLSINKTYNCSNICFLKNIKIDINKNECIHSCSYNGYNHECNNICYNECPENTNYKIKNLTNKDNIFAEYEDGVAICLEPNTEGYFLDEYELYEECYKNCRFCYGKGNENNNNCKKCIYNFFLINDVDDIKVKNNCYEKCKYYYYLNESKDYICTENKNCSGNFKNLVAEKSKCIDKCENDNIYKYEYENICNEKCPKGTVKSFKNQYICFGEKDIYQNDLICNEDIHQIIKEDILIKFNMTKEEEIIYKGEDNFFFHITSAESELELLKGKNNNTNKFSIIDLERCGNILKKNYNINENTSLILMKYERVGNISSERALQYEVYEPYNKTKLNLSICDNENVNIDIYIPVVLSEKTRNLFNELKEMGYNLFDINSPFYNDICTPYKSTHGTDVLLSDRVNSYFYNDDTSCQSNCIFSDYLFESNYLKCKCDMKNSIINTSNIKSFSAKSIYQSFYDVLKFSNYKVLKCSNLAFTTKNFTLDNKGSLLSLIYFFIYFLFLIIYLIKGINQLKNEFSKNIMNNFGKNHTNKIINANKIIAVKNKKNKNVKITNNTLFLKANKKIDKKNIEIYKQMKYKNYNKNNNNNFQKIKNIKENGKGIQKNILVNPPKKIVSIYRHSKLNIRNKTKFLKSGSLSKHILLNEKNNEIDKKNINKENFYHSKEEEKLDYYELNNLEFALAKKLDKRNFFQIYLSFLKREHSIIFTFITKDDHNISTVKYSRFFFLLCTDMAMNVFFFADETMHKMFLDYGKYNFIQQIPQIIYSTIVSKLIETFLCFLSLTDKYYYQAKDFKEISRQFLMGILRCVKIKIAFFFLFSSLMFIFYWYIITCFCSVYKNTQIAFIKDSLLSFVLGNLFPFAIYLFSSLFRIIALKGKKCNLECVYKLSNIIPLF